MLRLKNEKLSKSLVFAEPQIYLRFEKNRNMNYFMMKRKPGYHLPAMSNLDLVKKLTTYNLGQNNWNKVKKASKIRQEQKTLLTVPALFLTAITKVLFLEGRLRTRFYLYPILIIS